MKKKRPNNCFNLINPLAWFLREDHARTTPSPSGTDLKVKPTLEGLRASLPATGIADVLWFTTNKKEQNNKNEEA
ncbi:MAG: hypothetical protein ACYC1A_08215 [Spirochaetales bacterium]